MKKLYRSNIVELTTLYFLYIVLVNPTEQEICIIAVSEVVTVAAPGDVTTFTRYPIGDDSSVQSRRILQLIF